MEDWQRLAAAYEAQTRAPEPTPDEQTLLWFEGAWPGLRQDLTEVSDADAVLMLSILPPFLGAIRNWAAMTEVCRRGRDLTSAPSQLEDHLVFTHHLGIARQYLDDAAGAELAFAEVARRADAAGTPRLRAKALAHQAQLRRAQGEPGEATVLFHRAAEAYRAAGDVLGEARTLGDLAPAVSELGDLAGAVAYSERARDLFRSLGAHRPEAMTVRTLAEVRGADGDLDGAVALLEEAIDLFLRSGAPEEAARVAYRAAHLSARHGDLPGCLRYATRAGELGDGRDDELDRDIAEVIEYARTDAAARELAAAGSDAAADRLIAERPELRTMLGLALTLRARPDRAARLAGHPDSAARQLADDAWHEVRELAGEEALAPGLEPMVRNYAVAGTGDDIGVLERILALVPAATLPGVRARYLLALARSVPDDRRAIALATEAAELHRSGGADALAAGALLEAGMAWRRLGTGDQRQNKTEALSCLRRALRVYRRRTHPREWGKAMIALANVYAEYRADRRRSLNRARHRYAAAMTALTPESSPEGHATALAGLGLVLSDHALADDPENLERARRHLEQAAGTLDDPFSIATVLLNLSHCYRRRVLGDPDANRDLALLYARQSHELSRRAELPVLAAEAATAIGDLLATSLRRRDRRAWTEAVDWYRQALEDLSPDDTPTEYAAAADNLANTMSEIPFAIESQFDEIVTLHRTAIDIFQGLGDVAEASRATYNLAGTLGRRPEPDHDRIIDLYERSLAGRPIEDAPGDWAESVTELARSLLRRGRDGDDERAADLLRQVLDARTRADLTLPGIVLGRLLAERGDWAGAAVELSRAAAEADANYVATILGRPGGRVGPDRGGTPRGGLRPGPGRTRG